MGKRGNREGSIYQRRDGRWAAAFTIEGGRRKTLYGRTRQEVARKLARALSDQQSGIPPADDRLRVGAYLSDWLEGMKGSLRPSTWARYDQYVRLHVAPVLGKRQLSKLGPKDVQRLYAERREAGLSASSVAHLHRVLHGALEQAVRWGYIPRNPAALANPPRAERREMVTLTEPEVRRFLVATQEDHYHALYVLALTTGMRQGELLALRWDALDLNAGRLQVRGTLQRVQGPLKVTETKTPRSRRQLRLATTAVEALKARRRRQAQDRLAAGPAWHDTELVFTTKVGTPIRAGNLLRRSFWPMLDKAGLPRMRFHDLRHTAATLMLGRAVHPKIVAELLGHSRTSTTLDIYSHVQPTMHDVAARTFDDLLR